jgi:hypothetical protein
MEQNSLQCMACTFKDLRFGPELGRCERCLRWCARQWDVPRFALDLCLDGIGLLRVLVGVYFCKDCQTYFRAQPPFLRRDASYTNRVVATAAASVFEDGMSFRKTVERLARDFWLRPGEATIRNWCRNYAEHHGLDQEYQA